MNNEKSFFSFKKNNDCFQWKQTDGDMIFYNCKNKNQNFPLIITFTKSNSNTFKNNISNKSQNEEGNKLFTKFYRGFTDVYYFAKILFWFA